jgi:hypothetical protein
MSTTAWEAANRWQDLIAATSYVEDRLRRWREEGRIRLDQMQALSSLYARCREDWQHASLAGAIPHVEVMLPQARAGETKLETRLRYWNFVLGLLRAHRQAGILNLAQAHILEADARERMNKLERQIDEEIPLAQVISEEPRSVPRAGPANMPRDEALHKPGRPLMEILLDPRSIQWLLTFGGGLMIFGLIILLWVNEYFTPPVIALILGLVNAGLMGGGWAVIRYTRYQVAGRALTLLACLAMPLNLWYYHAHALMTIDGHLWVAALVISALYAASALVLRDELFVYVFVGGITLTGLLILADLPPSPQKFWEIASPATLLVVLGLISLHVERAFPEQEGPFSRVRFGMAFFWSGHTVLAAGLLLVLGAQAAADWLYEPFFKGIYRGAGAERTPIVTEQWGQILALCLVLAGMYTYLYSDLVVRRKGPYLYLAAGTLLWAEVLGIELLHFHLGMDFLIAVLAATGLIVNVAASLTSRQGSMARTLPVLGVLLGLVPVGLGIIVYLRALNHDLKGVWEHTPPSWTYVGAMVLTALTCRYGAFLARAAHPRLLLVYFFGTAAATLVAAVALLAALGLGEWRQHAPLLMLVPLAYLLAGRLYSGKPEERALLAVADAATIVMLVSSFASAFEGFTRVIEHAPLNLLLSLFFAEAALYFGLAAGLRGRAISVHACAATACAAVWQLLTYAGVSSEAYTLTFASVGLLLLIGYRFAVVERFSAGGLADAAFQSANVLLSLSFTAALFMGLSRLAAKHVDWSFVGLCSVLSVVSALAVGLVHDAGWRRWYVVTTISQVLLTFLGIQVLSALTIGQKLELFSVLCGLALLVVGHIGWRREQERHNDLVSLCLFLGSLLAGVPLVIATCVDRWEGQFQAHNEIGFFAVSVLLLATGFVFHLRSTALLGGLYTVAYFALLLLFVPWSRLNAIATIITIGGGVLFGTGLLLSVYRDRLLTLPDRIKRREGIYRVLSWR